MTDDPVELDHHRRLHEVQAVQAALQQRQQELENFLSRRRPRRGLTR